MASASEKYRSLVAVYAILVNDKNEVLLGRRCNTGYLNGWYDVPAGHLEDGETLREAAVRELLEEAGVKAVVDDLELVELSHRKSTDNRVYVDVFFKVKKWEGEPSIREPKKCDRMGWFPMDALPEKIVPYQGMALQAQMGGVVYREVGWEGN